MKLQRVINILRKFLLHHFHVWAVFSNQHQTPMIFIHKFIESCPNHQVFWNYNFVESKHQGVNFSFKYFFKGLLCWDILWRKKNIYWNRLFFIYYEKRKKVSRGIVNEAIKGRTCKIIKNTCKHTLQVIQSYTTGWYYGTWCDCNFFEWKIFFSKKDVPQL